MPHLAAAQAMQNTAPRARHDPDAPLIAALDEAGAEWRRRQRNAALPLAPDDGGTIGPDQNCVVEEPPVAEGARGMAAAFGWCLLGALVTALVCWCLR